MYNWDNRDIVAKDKREHAEKQRREFEQNREDMLERKMAVLKGEEIGSTDNQPRGEYQQTEKPVHSLLNQEMRRMNDGEKHVNLFEDEERLLQNKDMAELKRLKEEEFLKDKNVDYSTRFLGNFVNSLCPWYSKKKGTV